MLFLDKVFPMDAASEIAKLKKERNAVILVHNYQTPEVQALADYVGDSLELSRKAAGTKADVIVFCGVDFMAETAKILSPEKRVMLAEPTAACPMSAMITASDVRKLKAEHPGLPVVAYVNTSAAVKAESDIACTSANAAAVVKSLRVKKAIFIPDKHLAAYVQKETGVEFIPWHGYCPTHVRILPEHIKEQRKLHPGAEVLAHPECRLDVLDLADAVLGTGGMVKRARESKCKEFIIATDAGMVHRLRKELPKKKFWPASEAAFCPNMRKTTPASVLHALRTLEGEVFVQEDIMRKARKSIERMVQIS
ncbi:MAG: quinolinate synthase NadA [Candidatus Aenigmatarchaeota archaeon]